MSEHNCSRSEVAGLGGEREESKWVVQQRALWEGYKTGYVDGRCHGRRELAAKLSAFLNCAEEAGVPPIVREWLDEVRDCLADLVP